MYKYLYTRNSVQRDATVGSSVTRCTIAHSCLNFGNTQSENDTNKGYFNSTPISFVPLYTFFSIIIVSAEHRSQLLCINTSRVQFVPFGTNTVILKMLGTYGSSHLERQSVGQLKYGDVQLFTICILPLGNCTKMAFYLKREV